MKFLARVVWLTIKVVVGAACAIAPAIVLGWPIMANLKWMNESSFMFTMIVVGMIMTTISVMMYVTLISTIAHLIRKIK